MILIVTKHNSSCGCKCDVWLSFGYLQSINIYTHINYFTSEIELKNRHLSKTKKWYTLQGNIPNFSFKCSTSVFIDTAWWMPNVDTILSYCQKDDRQVCNQSTLGSATLWK